MTTIIPSRRHGKLKPFQPGLNHKENIHDLSGRRLENLDMTLVLAAYGSLTSVNLSSNLLVTLPANFCRLMSHIQFLDLSNNRMQKLPENFGLLVNLHSLILYQNQLQTLPVSFGKLDNLRWLDLAANPWNPQMKQVFGPDVTQGGVVAKNVREFFFLIMKAGDTCSDADVLVPPEAEPNLLRSPSSKGSLKCHTELYESALELLREYEEMTQPASSKTPSKSNFLKPKLTTRSQQQLQQTPAIPETDITLRSALLYFLFGLITVSATAAWVTGPPKTMFENGVRYKYGGPAPKFLVDTLAWILWATIYPLGYVFPSVKDFIRSILLAPRSPSILSYMFGL